MNQTALVTGASRGIGQAIAQTMARNGYRVLGTATSAPGAEQISMELGDQGKGYCLDLADRDAIDAFILELKTDGESPSVLVNNAGVTRDNLALRMKSEEWDDVIGTNLTGVFYLTQSLLRGMMKAKFGRIINISSVVGRMGNPGQANYAAAKAGLGGMSRALAAEIASRNITVNVVAPGFIETDMTRALSEDQAAAMLSRVPAGRLGQADEVAKLVGFLASDAASYVTGETIHINGGLFMS